MATLRGGHDEVHLKCGMMASDSRQSMNENNVEQTCTMSKPGLNCSYTTASTVSLALLCLRFSVHQYAVLIKTIPPIVPSGGTHSTSLIALQSKSICESVMSKGLKGEYCKVSAERGGVC